MRIPVHSPWLLHYVDVMQTILIILTMAGIFPDINVEGQKKNLYMSLLIDQLISKGNNKFQDV